MLFVEPHAGVQPVVRLIRAARHSVDINAYLINDRRILGAIRADTRRGVRVQVVMELRPHHVAPATVQREYQALAAAGAEVHWAPLRFSHHFANDPAMYMVEDGGAQSLIGTANFTYAAFHHDREYLWISHNRAVGRALEQVFNADWNHRRAGAAPRRAKPLVISPGGEQALLKVLEQPGPIDLETENFGYLPRIRHALEHKGRLASIIVPPHLSHYDLGNLAPLQRHGVNVRFLSYPHMHAKLIVGEQLAYIGSQNIRWVSLRHNRGVGIILHGRAATALRAQFEHDWSRASPKA